LKVKVAGQSFWSQEENVAKMTGTNSILDERRV